MGKQDIDDAMRNELTEEELEALESDDDVIDTDDDQSDDDTGEDTNVEEHNTDTGGDPDDDEGDDKPGEDDPDDNEEGEEAKPGKEGAQDDPDDKPDDKPAAKSDYAPSLRSELPEDFDEKLSGIAEQKTELRKKYNEGDIDFDEYEQERDKLDEQRRQLEQAQFKSTIAQEMREDRWINRDVANFMQSHPEYEAGSPLYSMLDAEVRKLQGEYDAEGKDPLDPAILDKAHETIMASLSKFTGAKGAEQEAPKGKSKIPSKRDVPPTLNNVPAADTEDMDGGRWAHMDRLMEKDPIAFEEKLAGMSDDDRNAYLASR